VVTALIIPNASMLRLLRSVGRVVVSQTQDHCECGYGREGTGAEASLSRDHRVEESVRAKVRAGAVPEKCAAEKSWPTELERSVRYRPSYVSS
jgi:hypothetical protein